MKLRKTNSTNYLNEAKLVSTCPLAAAMKLLGGRWKMVLIWYVHEGLQRYGELRKAIPNISEKMLSEQLKALEKDGLILRSVLESGPVYGLTELGNSLSPILHQLYVWGEKNKIVERVNFT